MISIITVVGARPQFIKASAFSRAVQMSSRCVERIIHTGQHYDVGMSTVFFQELGIPEPAYNLGVGSGNHGAQTGQMLEAIEKILQEERPDIVLVYGDTNSTLAGALAASKLHIAVAHVEAGLRSFNRRMPEEINRTVSDHLSDYLFTPTITATENLLREGIGGEKVQQVGDVMYDAALYYGSRAKASSVILRNLNIDPKSYVLATIHRQENTDNPQRLNTILDALCRVGNEMNIVLPLHPRTRKMIRGDLAHKLMQSKVRVIDPIGYLDMVMLEMNAAVIATDSGGVQKEAFFYKIPCITLRDETEWTELVDLGWNRVVVPSDAVTIQNAILGASPGVLSSTMPYGNGNSANLIVAALTN